jgi:hypothetical protein
VRQRQTGRVFTAEASCATGSQSLTCSSLRPVHRTHRQPRRYRREPLHIGAHSGSAQFVVTSPCTLMRTVAPMGARGAADYRARRRERERQRRQQQERAAVGQERARVAAPAAALASAGARRAAASDCGWCSGPITPRAYGPIPKWCSATCRKKAWEQKCAAESGRAAVEVVERVVVVASPTVPLRSPRHAEWGGMLRQLSQQLDRGILYDRDLPVVAGALREVLASFERRTRQG